MFYEKSIIDVINGDGPEPFHGALTEEKRSLLAIHHGGIHVAENGVSNLDLPEGNDRSLAELTVGDLVVSFALDVLLGKVAVLEHEVRLD